MYCIFQDSYLKYLSYIIVRLKSVLYMDTLNFVEWLDFNAC